MQYYLSGPAKEGLIDPEARNKARDTYEVKEGDVSKISTEALEVLNIYRAVPSTSVALKSVSNIVVGGRSKSR